MNEVRCIECGATQGHFPQCKTRVKSKHYCYGSGMHGCLYDYGPHFADEKNSAIDDLMFMFHDQLEDGEPARMRANLESDGYHKFENPQEAGAQYCDVSEHNGKCPVADDCGGYSEPDET